MGEIKRFKRSNQFSQIYEFFCAQKSVSPLTLIRAHLTENRLKFCCDRIDHDDWSPILNSLAADRSLKEIYVYSRYRPKIIHEFVDTEEKLDEYRRCRKTNSWRPLIYTNFLLRCFVDAVAVCTRDSSLLTSLSLDGIPLANSKYIEILCAGLVNNSTLESLSLARCKIGDKGCDALLRAIGKNSNIQYLDFTACSLTSISADFLVSFLTNKRLKLLEKIRQDSTTGCLEGSVAEQCHGLQILVLDKNRKFADDGFRQLTRILKDDFWLKKLSIRSCGLTRKSVDSIIDLLETNNVLIVINLKNNNIPVKIVRSVKRLLKKRRKNCEKIPIDKKMLKRQKKSKFKFDNLSNEKRAQNGRKIKRFNYRGKISKNVNKKCLEAMRPNLRHLVERLSTIIEGNRNLMRALANERHALVREKLTRLNAERSYQLLRPVFEKLRYGIQKHYVTRYRTILENRLCSDLRTIFRCLERKIDKSSINSSPNNINEKIKNSSKVILVDNLSQVGEKKIIFGDSQKNPN